MWFKKKKNHTLQKEVLKVVTKNGQISSITNFNSFQTRAESSVKMIMDAIRLGIPEKELCFTLHTGDYPLNPKEKHHFYYCGDSEQELDSIFPDFIFDHWQQAGIENFSSTVKKITAAASLPYIYNKMLWIGNVQTNVIREKIIAYTNEFPEIIEAYNTFVDQYMDGIKKNPYISLPDHTKYKYLIDIEGNGYSGRLKLLLYTKRLVFIQDRQWKSYYHFELKPYVHFIPVKNDLSDLLAQIKFVEEKGESYYQNIVDNAYHFASTALTYEHAIKRVQNLINSL